MQHPRHRRLSTPLPKHSHYRCSTDDMQRASSGPALPCPISSCTLDLLRQVCGASSARIFTPPTPGAPPQLLAPPPPPLQDPHEQWKATQPLHDAGLRACFDTGLAAPSCVGPSSVYYAPLCGSNDAADAALEVALHSPTPHDSRILNRTRLTLVVPCAPSLLTGASSPGRIALYVVPPRRCPCALHASTTPNNTSCSPKPHLFPRCGRCGLSLTLPPAPQVIWNEEAACPGVNLVSTSLDCVDIFRRAYHLVGRTPQHVHPSEATDDTTCTCGKEMGRLRRERGRLLHALRTAGKGEASVEGRAVGGDGDAMLARLNRRLVLQVRIQNHSPGGKHTAVVSCWKNTRMRPRAWTCHAVISLPEILHSAGGEGRGGPEGGEVGGRGITEGACPGDVTGFEPRG